MSGNLAAELAQALAEVATLKTENRILNDARLLKVADYCAKFSEWADIMRERYREEDARRAAGATPNYPQGEDFIIHLEAVTLAITKSSLLERMLYGGQSPRVTKCPLHKGVWAGLYAERPSHASLGDPTPCACWDGFEASGWIPEGAEVETR